MYSINFTNRFKKDLKLCQKRGLDLSHIQKAISILAETGSLPAQYRSHILSGKYNRQWECHIELDWLMVWEQNDKELYLLFLYTGTHSDLFK